ncbi:hypothetical protein GZ78_21365 [Endozoicomonas numazuensis]|uniref:Uncharacterized protein n=1 Tax=Endozoicomonas numazuensis TaxID=1137799 RepID=A0A081ND91_9GAMM|nr:hypothetical protein GZ78_21345 [Endozoicomonas numazuensis]KEQ16418.1 hypothetical protein GZ78_21365 [Endozoicomonas numazuensis]
MLPFTALVWLSQTLEELQGLIHLASKRKKDFSFKLLFWICKVRKIIIEFGKIELNTKKAIKECSLFLIFDWVTIAHRMKGRLTK